MVSMAEHIPVMYEEVLESFRLKNGDCVVDCTVGTGGHGLGITERIGSNGHYIGIERDSDSLVLAKERLKNVSCRCTFAQNDFRHINQILDELGINEVDAILFDLGISSYQLDDPARGFSLRADGPLDMRMDRHSFISAYDLVNSLSEREISAILKNFGQERWHHRIASCLVQERQKNPIASTRDLSDTVLKAIPSQRQRYRLHPATRTFQAFRIAVNRELEAIDLAIEKSIPRLSKGARICVISFHSLEDRIVKNKFRQFAKEGFLNLVVKKPLKPKLQEIQENPRSRSALLRIAERVK